MIFAGALSLSLSGGLVAQEAAKALDQRARSFGFAAQLPASTEMVLGVRNLKARLDEVGKSNFWKRFTTLLDDFGNADFLNEEGLMMRQVVDRVMGEDAFIAFADGSAKEFAALTEFSNLYNRIQYRMMFAGIRSGMGGGMVEPDPETVIKEALTMDDGKLLKVLTEVQLPPLIAGCRVTDNPGQILEQLDEMAQTAPPFVLVSSFNVAGMGEFKSWKIKAKDAFPEGARQEMRDELKDADLAAKIEAAIDSKEVEFCYGQAGDYLIFSIGKNHDHLKFAANPGESLVSRGEFAFADEFTGKKIVAWSFAADELYQVNDPKASIDALFTGMSEGLTMKGLGGPDFSATARELLKLSGTLGVMLEVTASSRMGVVFAENGLRGEALGGQEIYGLDYDKELVLYDALPENALLKIGAIETPEARQAGMAFMKQLGAVLDEGMKALATVEEGDLGQFAQQYKQMDPVLRPKLEKLWDLMENSFVPALGYEGALAVDLEGSMPQLKGIAPVPPAMIDKGKMPRIVSVSQVKDRKKLAESWEKLVPLINETIAILAPNQGPQGAPTVPEPMSSENAGLKTYFFMIPFLSNDFLPSVSVSDSLFFLSTSKTLSEQIAGKVGPTGKKGIYMDLDLEQLRQFGIHWLNLVDENKAALFGGDEFAAEDFAENLGPFQLALDFLDIADGFHLRLFRDGDDFRSSWHLKLEDMDPVVD